MELDIPTLHRFISDKTKDLDSNATKRIYNPIEFFIEDLVQKETSHSKLLADLLNPNGEHGKGELFLKAFLNEWESSNSQVNLNELSWEEATVKLEHFITTTLKEKDTERTFNGRIDIYLTIPYKDKENFLHYIIENKLNNAGFQYRQLEKYYKSIKEKNPNDIIRIITLGSSTSDSSPIAPIKMNGYDVARCIENAIAEDPEIKEALQGYINYLKNHNMDVQTKDNARTLLSELKAGDLPKIKALKEAFELLPQAYAERFLNGVNEDVNKFPNIETEEDSYYPSYINLWKSDASWVWLSIGFKIDKAIFYIVANERDTKKLEEFATDRNLTLSSQSGGWHWYIVNDENSLKREIPFTRGTNLELPDFSQLHEEAEKYLARIYKS